MTEHLPECCVGADDCDVDACQRCHSCCICEQLRDCEERVRENERSNNFTPDDFSEAMSNSYRRGLDAARRAVANTPMGMGAFNTKAADLAAIDALRKEKQ